MRDYEFDFWCLMGMFAAMVIGVGIIIIMNHLKTKKYIEENQKRIKEGKNVRY